MAVSKAQQKAVNKYMAANYDRINLTVAKGRKEDIQAQEEITGESVNGFIGRAIAETMQRDKTTQTAPQSTRNNGGEQHEQSRNGDQLA